ncbi:MAG TPA: nucleotide sugar dehydrogenase [Geminicoccaceae bacterium]|nr:nucleotide sugar dehydrogenase [Geminicoccaceae bacterium]
MSTSKIAVVGLGYVGLPLAVALAKHDTVTGYDRDPQRVRELSLGHDRTGEVPSEALTEAALRLTADSSDLVGHDVYIITVPTPVDRNNVPDLSAVRSACQTIGAVMSAGAIVVLESTVYPGATEEVVGPELAAASGLRCGIDFFLGYSPERINPGDRQHTVERLTKVVAGQTEAATDRIAAIYRRVTGGQVFVARDIRTAEAAKAIENAQRDINIAFVNEVAMICQRLGLSVYDVLDAARTKWNFLDFKPGLVGGHCIGVDPFYLAYKAQSVGHEPHIILAGRAVNDAMPGFVAGRLAAQLEPGASILVLGLTFKENVSDLRNSKAAELAIGLAERGLQVTTHDPLADPAEAEALYGLTPLSTLPDGQAFDAVLAAVPHHAYVRLEDARIVGLLRPGGLLADLKGIWRELALPDGIRRWTL